MSITLNRPAQGLTNWFSAIDANWQSIEDAINDVSTGSALSVVGRSANSSGPVADIGITAGKFLGVRGNILGAFYTGNVASKSSNYTVTADDNNAVIVCDTTSGAITISLPSAATVGAGFLLTIFKSSSTLSNLVTIDPNGSETINEVSASQVLTAQFSYLTLISLGGTSWIVIGCNDYVDARQGLTNWGPANATWGNTVSISLPPGEWELSGGMQVVLGTGTGWVQILMVLSNTSGTGTTDHVAGDNQMAGAAPTSTNDASLSVAAYRVVLTTTTTYYLKVRGNYTATGTCQVATRISARRVR